MAITHIIVVAGGSGTRFGAPVPKQFMPLAGRALIAVTLSSLRRALPDARVTVVVSPDAEARLRQCCAEASVTPDAIAYGGATRWESVRNGLATVGPDVDYVLVHDAARPFVTPAMASALLEAMGAGAQGAVPAVPVTDSLRRLNDNGSTGAIDRAGMYAVQTPQAFPAQLLREAYGLPYRPDFTDDASVMEAAGHSITIVAGDADNIKITYPRDLEIAELIAARHGL